MSFLGFSNGGEQPPPDGVSWNQIFGKPQTFAPSPHKNAHAAGGSDPLLPGEIGAVANAGGIEAVCFLSQADYAALPAPAPSTLHITDAGRLYLNGVWLNPGQAGLDTLSMLCGCSNFNPVQGTVGTGFGSTYTFAQVFDLAPAAQRRMGVPSAHEITAVALTVNVGGTLAAGASGPATLHLVNHSTGNSTLLLGGIGFTSAAQIARATGLSVALNATHDYSLRLDTPYFATPPTTVRLQANLYMKKP